ALVVHEKLSEVHALTVRKSLKYRHIGVVEQGSCRETHLIYYTRIEKLRRERGAALAHNAVEPSCTQRLQHGGGCHPWARKYLDRDAGVSERAGNNICRFGRAQHDDTGFVDIGRDLVPSEIA